MGRSVDEATGGGHKQIWKTEKKKQDIWVL